MLIGVVVFYCLMEEGNGTVGNASTGGANGQEEIVAKYKRLLNLARSNLESNQKLLAEKDQFISQLKLTLEEEKQNSRHRNNGNMNQYSDENPEENWPRKITRRVDVEGVVWVLVEYQLKDDQWLSFKNEQELNDFIQRIPGAPLQKPSRCLTVEESLQIVSNPLSLPPSLPPSLLFSPALLGI
jgi:hypothetical protein